MSVLASKFEIALRTSALASLVAGGIITFSLSKYAEPSSEVSSSPSSFFNFLLSLTAPVQFFIISHLAFIVAFCVAFFALVIPPRAVYRLLHFWLFKTARLDGRILGGPMPEFRAACMHGLTRIFSAKDEEVFARRIAARQQRGEPFAVRPALPYAINPKMPPLMDTIVVSLDQKVRRSVLGDPLVWKKNPTGGAALFMDSAMTRMNQPTWGRQRAFISKLFNHEYLQNSAPHLLQTSLDLCCAMRNNLQTPRQQKEGEEIVMDLMPLFQDVSLCMIVSHVLGVAFQDEVIFKECFLDYWRVHRRLNKLASEAERRSHIEKHTNTLRNVADALYDSYVKEITDDAQEKDVMMKPPCLMKLMILQITEEFKNGEEMMSKKEILDNCFSFLVAGFETVAQTSALLLLCSAQFDKENQSGQQRSSLYQELRLECQQNLKAVAAIAGSGELLPRESFAAGNNLYESLQKCDLLNRCVRETLRMYPPVMQQARVCAEDVEIQTSIPTQRPSLLCPFASPSSAQKFSNLTLKCPRGTQAVVDFVPAMRDEGVWGEDAEQFNPLRWTAPTSSQQSNWLPFGGGPRFCVAQNWALLEVKAAAAAFVLTFETAKPPHDYKMRFTQTPTLVLSNGAPIILS